MSYEDFDAVLDVHLRGAFHVVRPAFPVMCEAGYGRIVLTSSIGGLYGNHDVANYAAAKAGIIGLSNVVALEGAAEGVLCNVIVPSAVTRMADGLDISAYPPMGAELVAPVVGLLAHESCRSPARCWSPSRAGWPAPWSPKPRRAAPSWSMEDVVRTARRNPRSRRAAGLSGGPERSCRAHPLQLRVGCGCDQGGRAQWLVRCRSAHCRAAGRGAGRRPHRDGDGPVLHPDHGRHGRRRDQGRAAAGRRHPLHLGRAGARDERCLRQRQPRQTQHHARPAVRLPARPPCAR